MGAAQHCCDSVSEGKNDFVNPQLSVQPAGVVAQAGQNLDLGLNSPQAQLSPRTAEATQIADPKAVQEAAVNDLQDVKVAYKDGSSYEGQWLGKKRHGRGRWRSSAVQYEGEFVNDKQHGQGKQSWKDGRNYEGQFKEGKFGGRGRMEWHTQAGMLIYEGDYVKDAKHGKGKLTWPDGRCYDGEWVEGKREGVATYTNASGERRVGTWANDKLDKWHEDAAAESQS
jgi:hypothetical protein